MATHSFFDVTRTLSPLLSLFFVFFFTHLVIGLPINATDILLPAPFSSNSIVGSPVASCATLPHWTQWFQPSERFDFGDVENALTLFHNDYVRDHGDTKYEFLRSGVTPVRGIATQRLPLKIATGTARARSWCKSAVDILTGTCFVVIAMRNQFKQGELPAETPSPSAGSDISSFEQIYRGLLAIDGKCAKDGNPGWYPAGIVAVARPSNVG